MGPLEKPRSKSPFNRLKRSSKIKLQDSIRVLDSHSEKEINSKSPFLQLPQELRSLIYKHAFSRSPTECLTSIHQGSKPHPASSLRQTCRQIREETQKYHYQSLIIKLWPQSRQDVSPYSTSTMNKTPLLHSWIQSRNGITILREPHNVQQLALLISLKRESRTMCNNFLEAEILRKAQLQIKDLYIRVCICGTLKWLQQTPKDLISFSKALEGFVAGFSTLERIYVMYCGQKWPAWIPAVGDIPFADLVLGVQEDETISGDEYTVRPKVEQDPHQVEIAGTKVEDTDGGCRLQTVMTCNSIGRLKRQIEINYYDSWTVLQEKCVRNEPRQQKTKTVPKVTYLTAKPTPLKRGITKVKDFVEAVPLAPSWGIHKYLPATKDAGQAERGSHWRRY